MEDNPRRLNDNPAQPVGNPPGPSLDAARGKAVDILSEHFAHDRLSLDEFERWVGRVQEAKNLAGIKAVVRHVRGDLAGSGGAADSAADGGRPPMDGWSSADPVPRRHADTAIAVLGETKRTGHWVPARRTKVVATLGSVELDLRDAALGPGEFDFDVKTILGSVEIIAPEGLRVECGGSAILGSIDPGRPAPVGPGAGRPVVRVSCMAVLGEVEVDYRLPGETKRQAKRRRKRADRQRKRRAAGRSRVERGVDRKLDRFFNRQ